MIAKKGRGRKDGNTGKGFGDLAAYITEKDKAENIRVTNCKTVEDGEPDLQLALAEILATQALNTTAKSDKTYHLIISFREGERPSAEALADIEQAMCDKMGIGAHQRISAVHLDTDNVHLHVAINLVHPDTGRIVVPYQDYAKRSECCREMELKWDLQRDNGLHYITPTGEVKRDPTRRRNELAPTETAKLMEKHRGIESFQTWLGKEPANALRAVLKQPGATWQDIHNELDRHNLKLVKNGNGFAVVDKDNPKLAAKASQVGRFFSKGELEKRLGEYQANDQTRQISNVRKTRYKEKPTQTANVERREKQNALFKEYQATKGEARRDAWQQQRESEKARFANLAGEARAKRAAIRDGAGSGPEKRTAYKLAAMERVLQEQALRQDIARERAELKERFGHGENFRQFVTRRAQEGDEAALAALRGMRPEQSSTEREGERRDTLRPAKPGDPPDVIHRGATYNGKDVTHRVHRNGDVSYSLAGREALRDEGRVIRVTSSQDKDTVELGLRLAQKKFGKEITLTGSDDFKRLAVETAVERGIAVKFADPTWEAYRHQLTQQRQASEAAQRQDQFRTEREQTVPAGERVAFMVPYAEKNEARELGLTWDKERKAYTAEKGSQAAQDAAGRWPEKSDTDDRKQTEREAQPPAPVPTTATPTPAAEKGKPETWEQLVAERNATAAKVQNLPPHRLARDGEPIDGKMAGTTTLANGAKAVKIEREHMLADGRKHKEIVVAPMTTDTAKQLAKVKKGQRIQGVQREREFEIDHAALAKTRTRGQHR